MLGFVARYKKWVILFILVIAGAYTTKVVVNYQNSFYTCKIAFSNVSSVQLWSVQGETDYSEKRILVKKLTTSPSTIRLKKNVSYEAVYTGTSGYVSDAVQISNDTSVTISPDYSEERLQQLFTSEKQTLQQVITSIDPSISTNSYTINDGMYYDHAKWYITTLKSNQTSAQYYDMFVVVLERSGTTWKVAVKPTITASYAAYPSIPKSVISRANDYRQLESFDEIRQRTVTE